MRKPYPHRLYMLVVVLLIAICAGGCGYGEVSPKAYEYAKALYSICNRRDEQHLERFAEKMAKAKEAGEISEKEADWLADIVEDAREGDWEDAMHNARRMLEDQVG